MKIVLKIGTSSITSTSLECGVNLMLISQITELVHRLQKEGHKIVLVSSGAVGLGCHKLRWEEKPKQVSQKQAAASIGQILLAQVYQQYFQNYGINIGQVLLTRKVMQDREGYLNARITLNELLSLNVLPIVNENDVIADEEIKFSDNDNLAAIVSELIVADHMFMLTDTSGLYTADPRTNPDAKLISVVEEITPEIEALASSNGSNWSTGGMLSKLKAAKMATAFGTDVHIVSSKNPNDILEILNKNKSHGTFFKARKTTIDARKAWLAYGIASTGQIYINKQARELLVKGEHLSPEGVIEVNQKFKRGHAIEIYCGEQMFAKAISHYSSTDLEKIKGHSCDYIEETLGYTYGCSVIDQDDFVLLHEV